MAAVVPWDEMAKVFFSSMSADHGRESIDLRIVLGALLVKHVLAFVFVGAGAHIWIKIRGKAKEIRESRD